jgi:CO dehydrogenase maturation factor
MKIAVCGKGGTGKSTVVALLAGEFRKIGWEVVVIDSDESNSGLHWMLGLERRPEPLMDFVGGKIPFRPGMVEACLKGESLELVDTGDEVGKIVEKLQNEFI